MHIKADLDDIPAETDEPSPLYQAFEAIGLIGCIETDEQLSTTYKQKMDFSHKCGGSVEPQASNGKPANPADLTEGGWLI